MINPQSGGAVYQQLAALLRGEILTGRLRPGQRLPSERALIQQYGVARETARRAVAVLRAEGLVVVRRGHGVLVKEHPEIRDLTPPAGAVLSVRMPTAEERETLGIDDGVPVIAVTTRDGAEVYPGDRWQLRWPTS